MIARPDGLGSDYKLFRLKYDLDPKEGLCISFNDPNHDKTATLNLGDGKIYTLAYNRKLGEYELSLK